MENFRMYESFNTNILEELRNKAYIIEDSEIQEVINRLYELVEINEDYIDEAILAIEKLCDNNEEFKKEWLGALDDVESEVLEEGKMGKLASIALLALSMGISLTGCDVAPQFPSEPPRVETSVGASAIEEPIEEEPTEITDKNDREEINMEETKPTYEEIKNDITWYTKSFASPSFIISLGDSDSKNENTYMEVELTAEDRDDLIPIHGVDAMVPKKVTLEGGKIYYSINGGEIKEFRIYDPPYIN